jgi:hypothetical protein
MNNFAWPITILGAGAVTLGLMVAPALTASHSSQEQDSWGIAHHNNTDGAMLQATESTKSFFPGMGCGRFSDRSTIPALLMDGVAKTSADMSMPIPGSRNLPHNGSFREFGRGFCHQGKGDGLRPALGNRGLMPRW